MDNRALSGKVAWVTGSSRGLGRVMASHLGRLGATVVVHGTTPTSARAFGEAESLDQVARDVVAETGRRLALHLQQRLFKTGGASYPACSVPPSAACGEAAPV